MLKERNFVQKTRWFIYRNDQNRPVHTSTLDQCVSGNEEGWIRIDCNGAVSFGGDENKSVII